MNKIYILVRRSAKFYIDTQISFYNNAATNPSHIDGILKATHYWEDLFKCSWASTRHAIANIAMQHNITCMPDAVIMHSEMPLPTEGWIIPIDDDDLLDARIITKIRRYTGHLQAMHWPVYTMTCGKINSTKSFTANSYAIKSDFAASDIENIHKHIYASKHLTYKILSEKPLGLKITHPASMGMLKLYKDKEECIKAVEKYIKLKYTGLYSKTVKAIQEYYANTLTK
jgi:hypothetical protein